MQSNITVVIPSYNAEKVIEKCIQSLMKQTVLPYIIVVNDGSKDNTNLKLKKYEKFKNFLLINEENKGVSAARNKGIENCKTEYITFVDPDDWVDKNYIFSLIKQFDSQENIDMSVCNFQSDLNGKKTNICDLNNETIDKIDAINRLFLMNSISGSVCNKLFKMKIIKENCIFFDEGFSISEDFKFCFDYLKHCDGNVSVSKDVHYYYHVGSNGLSSTVRLGSDNLSSIPNQTKLFLQFLDEKIVKDNNELEKNLRSLITVTSTNFARGLFFTKNKESENFLINIIRGNIRYLLSNESFSRREKFKSIIILKCKPVLNMFDLLKWKIQNKRLTKRCG